VRASEVLRLLIRRGYDLGFDTLDTTVDVGDLEECAGLVSKIGMETMLLGCPLKDGAH
jgi:hypothetical protein